MIGGRFFLLLPWLLGFRTWPPGFVVAADREEGRSRGKLTACSRGVWLIWRRLVLVEIELEQVLPCSETAVHLCCSSRFGFGESEQERISIGKCIKFSFQRVLICLIRSSDEKVMVVSISVCRVLSEPDSKVLPEPDSKSSRFSLRKARF